MDFSYITYPPETVEDFLKADPRHQDKNGRTALMRYISKEACNDISVLLKLIKRGRGLHVNFSDIHGRIALHYAFVKGKLEMITLLIENGADVSAVDNSGGNMLHYVPAGKVSALSEDAIQNQAAKNKLQTFYDDLRKVIESGADVNQLRQQTTPLMKISSTNCWKIAIMYLQYGADVNYIAQDSLRTCLHYASNPTADNEMLWNRSDSAMVTELILHGANINHLDRGNYSPLGIILNSHHDKKSFFAREYVKAAVLANWRENIDFLIRNRQVLVELESELQLVNFKNSCDDEIQSMRTYALTENLNLCQFAIGGFRVVATDARTEVCIKVCNYLLSSNIPIYEHLIFSRLETFYMRRALSMFKISTKNNVTLTRDINVLLAAKLSISDMLNLMKASII